jgi:c-di-GMP-binding flagellar brake protein YcgR
MTERSFVAIESPAEALELLQLGSTERAPAMFWTQDQSIVLNGQCASLTQAENVFHTQINDAENPQAKKLKPKQKFFFSISLSSANLFFRSTFIKSDHLGLRFSTPDQIFKVQQRKDVRLGVDERDLRVTFNDTISRKVLDLSASGLSFEVSDVEKADYPVGKILEKVVLNGMTKSITGRLQVRHTKQMDTHVRVGTQFIDLLPQDRQILVTHILEEIQKAINRGL